MIRRTKAALSGSGILALAAALVMTLVLTVTVGAMPAEPQAPDIPNLPHFFYGTVATDQGVALPGKDVVARTVTGTWTGSSTTTVDSSSRYGYAPQFYIPGRDPGVPNSGAQQGDQIAFFVQGVQATLFDVSTGLTSSTYPMKYGGDTHLNLIVPLRYTITATAGPNGSITPSGAVVVNYGASQTFTFTPNANYLILDVLVDGVSNPAAVAAGSYTFSNVTQNHTIAVTFVKATYVITPTAGPGCTITPGTPQTVPYQGSQSFTIAANTGYDLVDVTVNGVSQGPITSYTFTNVQADGTIAATCRLKQFEITATAGPNGSITPSGAVVVDYGANQTFTFTPNTGYLILDVLVDGVSNPAAVAAGSYTFSNVTTNHTIAVTFKPQEFVITPTAGLGCTITPGTPQTVPYGGSQSFTIAANTGYDLVDVTVNGVSQGPITSYTFTNVQANGTIAATCRLKQFEITATAGPNGSITPSGVVVVDYGASQTFTFTPNTGYLILDVLVDGVSNPAAVAAGSYTFSNVTQNHTIHVTFRVRQFVITPTAGPGCTITPGTPQTVPYMGSRSFTIAANTGYDLVDVRVNGVSQGPITSYTFVNVTANGTIAATCRLKQFEITATAGPNGSITPSGAVVVNYGANQTFTFTPNANYLILDVLVDGVSNPAAVAAGSYTFNNVTQNHTIAVTFVKATYVITPTAGPGCTITPGTPQTVPYLGSRSFTIAANTGYDLVDVTVNGVSQGPITSYTFTNVQADGTIAAICKLKDDLVITATAGPNGSITPSGAVVVSYGTNQTFIFTPNAGYLILDVLVDGVSNPAAVAAGSYTFSNVTQNHTIHVTFKPREFVITPTAGAGGSITPGTPQTVPYGGSVTFQIEPDPDYVVDDVVVNGVSLGAITTYTFTNVTADGTITVTFRKANRLYLPLIQVG